ncbi:MAG: ribonuclease III domain-containing protein, partial [Polyangiaceae bacterium]
MSANESARARASLAESRAALATLLEGLLGSPLTDGERLRLDEALTHPSFANEAPTRDNQRLEFLGDAVLGLCVSEILILAQPDADEG